MTEYYKFEGKCQKPQSLESKNYILWILPKNSSGWRTLIKKKRNTNQIRENKTKTTMITINLFKTINVFFSVTV